jgi:hypothetical protein
MPLPGSANEPLVLADGSVLSACGSAIVRLADDRLERWLAGLTAMCTCWQARAASRERSAGTARPSVLETGTLR